MAQTAEEMAQTVALAALNTGLGAAQTKNQLREANRLARQNFEIERAANKEDTAYYWNKYNSPAAKMRAAKEAGLNPEVLFGSGGSGSSIGTSGSSLDTPSAPAVADGGIIDAYRSVVSAENTKLQSDEMRRSVRYNEDSRRISLLQAEAKLRAADAEAVIKQKEAGVFDARRYEESLRERDRHFRHLRDMEAIDEDNNRKLRELALRERIQQHTEQVYEEGESMRQAELEYRRGQQNYVNAQTEGEIQKQRFLDNNGRYPSSSESLVTTMRELFDWILFPDRKPSGSLSNSLRRAVRRNTDSHGNKHSLAYRWGAGRRRQ